MYESIDERLWGHLAFKTKDSTWLNTTYPVVILISVHSNFHKGADGYLKMEALLSTIKTCVKGKVAILIADTAHLHTRHLLEGEGAKENCLRAAKGLFSLYRDLFTGCELIYWNSLSQDSTYLEIRSHILTLFHSDEQFQKSLFDDAESGYTENREREFRSKAQFIEKTIDDLLEQCVVLQLLGLRGYRYLFYPGAPCKATEYLDSILHSQLQWIAVFLTIEKKTRIQTCLK